MKKITTLFLAFIAITAAYAQNNNLVVFSENGERFYLILNGIKQNATPETNVKVTGLNAPNYKAKIIFEAKNIPDYTQNVYLMSGGVQVSNTEYTYTLKKKKDSYKLAWMSEAPISVDAAPASNQTVVTYTTTDAVAPVVTTTTPVNTSSTTTTTTTTTVPATTTTTTNGTGQNVSMGVNVNGVGMNMNVNINDGTNMSGTTTSTTTSSTTYSTTVTSSSSGNISDAGTTTTVAPVSNNSTACMTPMSSSEFADAKKSISSKSFSDTQLTMAKQIIKANCLSTAQVKEIMMIFSFEDTKLDLAKFAYNRTTDPNNYYKLNDAFTFESTIEELDKYVESHKK